MRGVANAISADRPRPEGFYHPDHIFALSRPTLDQVIARHPMLRRRDADPLSLCSSCRVSNNRFHDYGTWTCVSYNGQESQNLPIRSVDQLFEHLFGVPVMGSRDSADRATVLDAVAADARALRARLGMSDRARLDAHLEHIAELQRDLRAHGRLMCTSPMRPARGGGFDGSPGDEPLQDKLVAMARLVAARDAVRPDAGVLADVHGPWVADGVSRGGSAPRALHQLCHDENWELSRRATIYSMQCFRRRARHPRRAPPTSAAAACSTTPCCSVRASSPRATSTRWATSPCCSRAAAPARCARASHIHMPSGNLARVHLTIQQAPRPRGRRPSASTGQRPASRSRRCCVEGGPRSARRSFSLRT
jgi:hypothetical protein